MSEHLCQLRLGMSLPRETNLTAVAMLAPAAVGLLAVGELEVLAVGELGVLAVGELEVLQAELSELPQHRCGRSAFR